MTEETAIERFDYKAERDPPHLHPNDGSERMAAAFSSAVAEWRAAAWGWHDRRHALAGRLTLQDAWPRCLRWTDAECDQVDRWIANGEETPECFWVRLKPAADSGEQVQVALPTTAEITVRPLVLGEWEVRVGGTVEPGVVFANDEEEALARAAVQLAEDEVRQLRREMESAEQKLQRARVAMLKSSSGSIDAFLAPSNLRPADLKTARASIPSGSIRCAQWEEGERTVRLGLQLGDAGPGLWLEVSRQELGHHAEPHEVARRSGLAENIIELRHLCPGHEAASPAQVVRCAIDQLTALQLERERLKPEMVFEAVRLALAKLEAVAAAPFAYAADGQREAMRILRGCIP